MTTAAERAEAAKDAVAIVRSVTTGKLQDVDLLLSTVEPHEIPALLIALAGLACTFAAEFDACCARHGEPMVSGSFLAAYATWDGMASHRDQPQ